MSSKSPDDFESIYSRLSTSSLTVLGVAVDLRNESPSTSRHPEELHMPHLLAGLFLEEGGPAQRLQAAAGISNEDVERVLLEKNVRLARPSQSSGRPTSSERLLPLSSHVKLAFSLAQNVADIRGATLIRTHHLLHGALSVTSCSSIEALNALKLLPENVSLQDPTIAGYGSDTADGDDRLGIMREVEALCSVLAAKKVDPPLSLGLFGDWGSGKSFFMHKMRAKIKDLADEARRAPEESAYCTNIVQLEFNAWHYIDTDNLWATLANEVFEGLARTLAEEAAVEGDRGQAVQQRTVLLDKIVKAESSLVDAEQKKSLTDAALRQSEEKIRVFADAQDGIADNLGPRRLISIATRIAAEQPEVSDSIDVARQKLDASLRQAAAPLGLPPGAVQTAAVKEQLLALPETWGRLRAFVLAAKTKDRRVWIFTAAIVIVVLLIVWLWSAAGIGSRLEWLTVLVAGLLGALSPLAFTAERLLRISRSATAAYRAEIEETKDKQLQTLSAERDTLQAQADAQQQAVTDQRQAVTQLKDQFQLLHADRRMADFIRTRYESDDYRRRLGVIASVHDDFERLSNLLAEAGNEPRQPSSPEAAAVRDLLPRIDRIILYIDDLDRCPEKQVVEVLQAVHLLLAFPLFVVVVGVDSRWLLHSLKQHSEAFQSKPSNGDGDGVPAEEHAHWQSTPLNYLEKIFQIPFALRPMEAAGFGALIDQLTTAEDKAKQARETSGNGASGQSDDGRSAKPVIDKVLIEIDPGHLNFESWERDFMKKLSGFIPSPRAAKRFVNIYRLVKASVDAGETATFVGDAQGGHYRSAMLLLAIMIGYPAEANEIFLGLVNIDPKTPWWSFLDASFRPGSRETQAGTNEPGDARDQAVRIEAGCWAELFAKFDEFQKSLHDDPICHGFDLPDCSGFKQWGRPIARYSFQSREILLT